MKKFKLLTLGITAVALAATLFMNNGFLGAQAEAQQAGEAPQAMPVQIVQVEKKPVQIWKDFSGQVVAVDRAEIRPQVDGRITEILFEDGQYVEKGDVLIVIDPRPYEAALNQAEAALDVAMAEAALAEKEYQRAKKLIDTDAISQSMMDERTNRRNAAAAAVKGAQAMVESAEIDLDYAYVKAPISGKTSRAEITEGNLVQSGPNAPLLTSIVADKQFYIDFEINERTYLKTVKNNTQEEDKTIPVHINLPVDNMVLKGHIQSFDNRIDPDTGTVRARAIFDNDQGLLLPGMSVSVKMGSAGDQEQILLTERAIGTDQDRKFVYTVNGDKVAEYRMVTIGDSIDGKRIILSGLSEGEKVIAEGIVRIRPGMLVVPQTATETEKEQDATDTSGATQ